MHESSVPELYGIIGYPLGHSLSPFLHTTAFRLLDLPGFLTAWPMPPERLSDFVAAMRLLGVKGCCVTIPHKEAIMPLLDEVTDRVREIGSVNTLYRDGERICGDNTDILGFTEPLLTENLSSETATLVLGAGGTARSVLVGLRSLGLNRICVTSRRPEQARGLADEFGCDTVAWERRDGVDFSLLVNTTALGMAGKYENETAFPREWLAGRRKGLAYDVVYTPHRTRLLRDAAMEEWRTIPGLEMFLGQAGHQFRIWTGRRFPPEARRLVAQLLASRSGSA